MPASESSSSCQLASEAEDDNVDAIHAHGIFHMLGHLSSVTHSNIYQA